MNVCLHLSNSFGVLLKNDVLKSIIGVSILSTKLLLLILSHANRLLLLGLVVSMLSSAAAVGFSFKICFVVSKIYSKACVNQISFAPDP